MSASLDLDDLTDGHPGARAELARLRRDIDRLRGRLKAARDIVDQQANDEAIWFQAVHITEVDLQAALRRLHAAIEEDAGVAIS